jgi:hypothetical protein
MTVIHVHTGTVTSTTAGVFNFTSIVDIRIWEIRVDIGFTRKQGSVRAQDVNRRFLTAEIRVCTRVTSCDICDKIALGQGFLRVLPFSLVSIILPLLRFYSYIWRLTTGLLEAQFYRGMDSPSRNNNSNNGE